MHVVITGANRGIGLEFVRRYLADGARVTACCREPDNAPELARQGGDLHIVKLDVNKAEHILALGTRLADDEVDLLINNAGVYGPRNPRLPLNREAWAEVMATNMMAPMDVTWAALPGLRRARGVVATITSKMGSIDDNGSGGSYIYRASKAGLNAAMHSLAIDLEPEGIRALLLHPGWVRTDMGGPNGLIDVAESVDGMRGVIASVDSLDNGGFYAFDGKPIPW